jgi:hypothetical protein
MERCSGGAEGERDYMQELIGNQAMDGQVTRSVEVRGQPRDVIVTTRLRFPRQYSFKPSPTKHDKRRSRHALGSSSAPSRSMIRTFNSPFAASHVFGLIAHASPAASCVQDRVSHTVASSPCRHSDVAGQAFLLGNLLYRAQSQPLCGAKDSSFGFRDLSQLCLETSIGGHLVQSSAWL